MADTSNIPSPFPPPLKQPLAGAAQSAAPVSSGPEPEQESQDAAQAQQPEQGQPVTTATVEDFVALFSNHTDTDLWRIIRMSAADSTAAIAAKRVLDARGIARAADTQATPPPKPKYVLTQPRPYFTSGQFDKEVQAFQAAGNLRTGYKTLDRIQPLYPGFYCLGAISSLGKTTFCHQMADQIAASGQWVLYFSLEQSHLELYSKSLARGFFKANREDTRKNNRPSGYPTPSSIDIRRGLTSSCPSEMAAQIDAYMSMTQERLCIIDGAFSVTIEDIRLLTEQLIQQIGVKPVVVVDYLQIIAPTLINGRIPDTKTSIDHIVHSLKVLQRDFELAVIAISSLNRMNYLTPVDFESFKESGGIEYTADVIWGLQLSILNDKAFYHHYDNTGKQKGETSLKEKREKIQQEKASTPRHIDLVCLKNRYGVSSYTVPFEYYPASDYFCAPFDPNDPATWD